MSLFFGDLSFAQIKHRVVPGRVIKRKGFSVCIIICVSVCTCRYFSTKPIMNLNTFHRTTIRPFSYPETSGRLNPNLRLK